MRCSLSIGIACRGEIGPRRDQLVREAAIRRCLQLQHVQVAAFDRITADSAARYQGFVSWVRAQMRAQGIAMRPSAAAAWQAFRDLGHRPEPFLDALRILAHSVRPGEDADAMLRAVVWTKRASLADRELAVLEDLGPLAQRIFSRIASHEGEEARGIYSNEALEDYTAALGTEVRADEVQTTVVALQQKNLIRRMGHGAYSITDPFVKQVWLEREPPSAIGMQGGANPA